MSRRSLSLNIRAKVTISGVLAVLSCIPCAATTTAMLMSRQRTVRLPIGSAKAPVSTDAIDTAIRIFDGDGPVSPPILAPTSQKEQSSRDNIIFRLNSDNYDQLNPCRVAYLARGRLYTGRCVQYEDPRRGVFFQLRPISLLPWMLVSSAVFSVSLFNFGKFTYYLLLQRKRKRASACPYCGYCLRHHATAKCPECGTAVSVEQSVNSV